MRKNFLFDHSAAFVSGGFTQFTAHAFLFLPLGISVFHLAGRGSSLFSLNFPPGPDFFNPNTAWIYEPGTRKDLHNRH